jgi:hypothetical protein
MFKLQTRFCAVGMVSEHPHNYFIGKSHKKMNLENAYEEGIDIMHFSIGSIPVIDDTRVDVSQLDNFRGSYLQVHKLTITNLDTIASEIHRVIELAYVRVMLRQNNVVGNDVNTTTFFQTLITLFPLYDQCAVFASNVLGDIRTPDKAVFFGKGAKKTAKLIANNPLVSDRKAFVLGAFGYEETGSRNEKGEIVHAIELEWHSILTLLRGRFIHRQGIFFKSDLIRISSFMSSCCGKWAESRIEYQRMWGNTHLNAYDFISFLLLAAENLVSLIRVCRCLYEEKVASLNII